MAGFASTTTVCPIAFAKSCRPIETLRSIYEKFSIGFGKQQEDRIRTYLDSKPRDKYGRHEYRVEDLGVDVAEERARFRAYQDRFSVESEI